MKKIFLLNWLLLITSFAAFAYPGGVSGYTLKNGTTGCGCHGSALTQNVQVVIAGPTTLTPGEQGNFTATISGGSGTGVGIDIACSNGTLINSDANLKVLNSELTHPSKKTYSGGQYVFNFKYTAPSIEGQYTLYATGCSKKSEWNHGTNFIINVSLPVELLSFTSLVIDKDIEIKWNTATEVNNKGFELYRNGKLISFINGNGTTSEIKSYSFRDVNLKNGIYNYQLKQVDFDGRSKFIGELNTEISSPGDYLLSQNYPNPFNPSTTISYQLPEETFVTIKIYNVAGDEVAVLVNEKQPTGYHKVNFSSAGLMTGVYFYKLITDKFTSSKKMIIAK